MYLDIEKYVVEINGDHQLRTEAFRSELAVTRESATITWVWQTLKHSRERGKFYNGKRKEVRLHMYADGGLLA